MIYDLAEFDAKLPYDTHIHIFDDNGDFALFAARWLTDEFADLPDFVRFCFRYSRVYQPYVTDPSRTDIPEWFVADSGADARALELVNAQGIHGFDAERWVLQYFDTNPVPWLASGQHTMSIEIRDAVRPELFGRGAAGYINLFIGDAV